MDLYLLCLILGAVGLSAMAITGLGRHHGGASHGHGHGGHVGHGGGHGHAGGAHGHGAGAHSHGHAHGIDAHGGTAVMMGLLMTPRIMFAVLLGFGAAGMALRDVLAGPFLLLGAVLGGVIFERLLMRPLWNFAMRFASNPAVSLEGSYGGEATAVTSFDRKGQGIVSIEVDGHLVQILATLMPAEQEKGIKVRAGQLVRIEDVDAARNRCSVSAL